jgi:hypothetical protein
MLSTNGLQSIWTVATGLPFGRRYGAALIKFGGRLVTMGRTRSAILAALMAAFVFLGACTPASQPAPLPPSPWLRLGDVVPPPAGWVAYCARHGAGSAEPDLACR